MIRSSGSVRVSIVYSRVQGVLFVDLLWSIYYLRAIEFGHTLHIDGSVRCFIFFCSKFL